MVKEGAGFVYTRPGNFLLNSDAQLVTGQGHQAQGYELDSTGSATGPKVDTDFGNIHTEVRQTGTISLHNNLSADATEPLGSFDPTDWDSAFASSNYTTNVRVADSPRTSR